MSSGSSRSSPSSGMKPYSRGSGASPDEVHLDVLAELAQRERRREQRAERVAVRVLVGHDEKAVVLAQRRRDRLQVSRLCVILGCELVDQLAHPHATLDRRIVLEGQLRGPLHPQLAREPRLQQPVRGLEPAQRRAPLLLASRARSRRPSRAGGRAR